MLSTVAVGTDGSPTASEAVAMAVELARRFEARLVLLSAFKDSPGTGSATELQWTFSSSARVREILSRTEDELRRQGIDCTTRADAGDPADVLVQLAVECEADLLVIGNRAWNGACSGAFRTPSRTR